MDHDRLERSQGLIYLVAVALGLTVGMLWPGLAGRLELLVWPLLGALLLTTFLQVPLGRLGSALADSRFMLVAIGGNFLLLPLLVFALLQLLPDDPALRLGVLLVLLVPCTDWFIAFNHLGRGDNPRAIAFTPVSLLLQLVLLPVYLWLFLGTTAMAEMLRSEMLVAFFGLIVTPLVLAWLIQRWQRQRQCAPRIVPPGLPVVLLAAVVFVVAASQVTLVLGKLPQLAPVTGVFVLYLVVALLLARVLASLFRLPAVQGRVLAFSLGSRNSFVVLPIALALPAGLELVAVVIVLQSLIELGGLLIYLRLVPRWVFP